jgi:hypothetical protein
MRLEPIERPLKLPLCRMQSAYLLYEPLLSAGIRLLRRWTIRTLLGTQLTFHIPDYVGAQDANCNQHGIMSFVRELRLKCYLLYLDCSCTKLKLLQSPFQEEFLRAPDVPWATAEDTTVRVVGEGAGNMTWILIDGAGHFVRIPPAREPMYLYECRWLTTSLSLLKRSSTIG